MKITICGSMTFVDEMLAAKGELEAAGHEVKMPPTHVPDNEGVMTDVREIKRRRAAAPPSDEWTWDFKERAIRNHFDKVAWADAILVLNYDKNDVANYVGANSLMEMGLAFYLNKKIYLLNPIPDAQYSEEIIGMRVVVLKGDLTQLVRGSTDVSRTVRKADVHA